MFVNRHINIKAYEFLIVFFLIIFTGVVNGQRITIDKLKDLHINTMLVKSGRPNAVIVVPSDGRYDMAARLIQKSILDKSGISIPVVSDQHDPEVCLQDNHAIVLGNMATNPFIYKLYCQWYTFLDAKYPGKGGYVVRSLHNPYGTGKNTILIGGSDNEGVMRAAEIFCDLLPSNNPLTLGWIMEIKLGDGIVLPEIGLDGSGLEKTRTWKVGVRGGAEWGWNPISRAGALYYMTGKKEYLDCFKNLVKPDPQNIPVAIRTFYSFVNLERPLVEQVEEYTDFLVDCIWDLIEESPLFTDEERLYVTKELLDHQYFRDPNHSIVSYSPGRHTGYALFGIYTGSRYFAKYYPDPVWDKRIDNVRKSYQAFIGNPSWGNDNLFFMPSFAQYIIDFFVMDGADAFVSSGTAKTYADGLLAIRAGEKTGDYYNGVSPFLLNMIAHTLKKDEYFWLVSELEYDTDIFRLGRSFWPADDARIKPPADIVNKMLMFPLKTTGIPEGEGFEILSYSSGLSDKDDYFLVDGHNGGGRSSFHVNNISKLRMFGGEYLLDGFNNDVDITCRGLADSVVARAAALKRNITFNNLIYLQTEVPGMTNSTWQRNMLYLKDAGFLVIDKILATKSSEFDIQCSWSIPVKQIGISFDSEYLTTDKGLVISYSDPCEIKVERGKVAKELFTVNLAESENFSIGNLIYYETNSHKPSNKLDKVDNNTFLISGKNNGLIVSGSFNSEEVNVSAGFALVEPERILLVDMKQFSVKGKITAVSDIPVSLLWDLKTNKLEIVSSKSGTFQYGTDSPVNSISVSPGRRVYENIMPPAQLSDNIRIILNDIKLGINRENLLAVRQKKPEKVNWKPLWEINADGDATLLDISNTGEIWASWDKNTNYVLRKVSEKGKVLDEINDSGKILSLWVSRNPDQSASFSVLAGLLDDSIRAYSDNGKTLWSVKAEIDPFFKVGDKYVAPWFTDPEQVTGVYDILVDDLWGSGKEEIVIARPATLEFRRLNGDLIKRLPTESGTNTHLGLLKRSAEEYNFRLLLAGKFITGYPGITAIDHDYDNISNNLFYGVKSGWTSMNGWGQQGSGGLIIADINNDGSPEVITSITGHWNEIRVWNSNIRISDKSKLKKEGEALPILSGGTSGPRLQVNYERPVWLKYFGSHIEGAWIIQGYLQREPYEKMKDQFMKAVTVSDLNGNKYKEIIVGLRNGWLHVFDHQGELLWQHKFDSSIRCVEGVDGKKGKLIVGLSNGSLHVLDANGKIINSGRVDTSVEKIVNLGSRVVIGTSGGKVAEYRLK